LCDVVFSGTIQQIGRKNLMVLNAFAYTSSLEVGNLWTAAFDYADALELWVKFQFAVAKIIEGEAKASFWTADRISQRARMQTDEYIRTRAGGQNIIIPVPVSENFKKIDNIVTWQGAPMRGFYISNTLVTQREYESIMRQNPSEVKNPAQPVSNVSFMDAMLFCNEMSIRNGLDPAYNILIDGRNIDVFFDNFASGYRLANTDEWNLASEQIDGMGTLAEYIHDGESIERDAYYRNSPKVKFMAKGPHSEMARILLGNGIPFDEGTVESRLSGEEVPPFAQDLGEVELTMFRRAPDGSRIPMMGRNYKITPVIRLVRPIFDYWKFPSGE